MTDAQRYENAKANGKPAEMEVHGVLRGGYFHGKEFALHRGTSVQFVEDKNVKIHP